MLERLRPGAREEGFTLVEMAVATLIISAVLGAFGMFLVQVSRSQRSAVLDRIAARALGSEMEKVAGMRWDDIMINPGSAYADCSLPGGRRSAQSVYAGPEKVTVNGLPLSVSRSVKWNDSGTSVTCSGTADSYDLKKITVTVQWNDGTATRTRTASVLRSRWAEVPGN